MTLHQNIINQIKDALRAKDSLRLETLRGLNALFQNELLSSSAPATAGTTGAGDSAGGASFLPDEKALPLVKRSVKQRKDSIEQFEKGGREDLALKEKAELAILETFLPKTMSRDEIRPIVDRHIAAAKSAGTLDARSLGKLVGAVMKELDGRADGSDVKAVIDERSA